LTYNVYGDILLLSASQTGRVFYFCSRVRYRKRFDVLALEKLGFPSARVIWSSSSVLISTFPKNPFQELGHGHFRRSGQSGQLFIQNDFFAHPNYVRSTHLDGCHMAVVLWIGPITGATNLCILSGPVGTVLTGPRFGTVARAAQQHVIQQYIRIPTHFLRHPVVNL